MKKSQKKVKNFTTEQMIQIGMANLNLNPTLYDMMLGEFKKKHEKILCSKEWYIYE